MGYGVRRIYAGHHECVLLCGECQLIAVRLLRAHVPAVVKLVPPPASCLVCQGTGQFGDRTCPNCFPQMKEPSDV